MPAVDLKQPRPACVEDWDEDAQTTLSFTRTTANVAAKRPSSGLYVNPAQIKYSRDGSDSGYSSKAATVASVSTNGKKAPGLSVNTSVCERERHPYAMTPSSRPDMRPESFPRPITTGKTSSGTRDKPYCHPKGVCWTCDQIGYHVDAQEYARLTQPPTPKSPVVTQTISKADVGTEARVRRHSSRRETRPSNIYPPSAMQPLYATTPAYPSPRHSTPITPQNQVPFNYDPMIYSYAVSTPVMSNCVGSQDQIDYFVPYSTQTQQPAKPQRRSSIYGEPLIQQSRRDDPVMVGKGKVLTKETRPIVKSHRSSRSVDQQWDDKKAMRPPARPNQPEIMQRPSIKKSATYSTAIVDHRKSKESEGEDSQGPPRQESAIRKNHQPSSAYRNSAGIEPTFDRPHVKRKSESYSDPIPITKTAPGRPQDASHRSRQITETSIHLDSIERKAADAEAYIQRKTQLTAEQLTAEKAAEIQTSQCTAPSRSETGSTFSQPSVYSSSKASSGHGRSRTAAQGTSIIIDGIKVDIPKDYIGRGGRPLSLQFNDLSISVGGKEKSSTSTTSTSKREQKLLEKAPSVTSHTSQRSGTNHNDSLSQGKATYTDDGDSLSKKRSHVSASRASVTDFHKSHDPSSAMTPRSTRASIDRGKGL